MLLSGMKLLLQPAAVGVLTPLLVLLTGRGPLPPASRPACELRWWLPWNGDSSSAQVTTGMQT